MVGQQKLSSWSKYRGSVFGTDLVDFVAEMDFVSILVVLEVNTHVVPDRLVMTPKIPKLVRRSLTLLEESLDVMLLCGLLVC